MPDRTDSHRRPGWHTRDVARATIVVLLVLGAAYLFVRAHLLVFVAFLGVLLGLAVSAGAERLERYRIPRGVGAPLIVAVAIAALVGFGALTGPTVRSQYRELRVRLPEAFAQLDHWLSERQGGVIGALAAPQDSADMAPSAAQYQDTLASSDQIIPDSLQHVRAIRDRLLGQARSAQRFVVPAIHVTIEVATGIVLVLFMALYIGIDARLYRHGILELVPHRARPRAEQVIDAARDALRRWLVTQLIAMLVMGVVTTIVLLAMHVRAAVPLGILAGLLEFIPTVGPILSAVPSVAMAFIDSPEKAAAVAVAYYFIHFTENHLLIPILMKEGVNLPPVLTILTQAAMALAFGFMGLFVAVPMLVLATILVKMLYVEDVIGDPTRLPYTVERPPTGDA
jgi:predicted PurR-regulated permease PerM